MLPIQVAWTSSGPQDNYSSLWSGTGPAEAGLDRTRRILGLKRLPCQEKEDRPGRSLAWLLRHPSSYNKTIYCRDWAAP